MKVKQNKRDWAPITITLETEEEANVLYFLLKDVEDSVVKESCRNICANTDTPLRIVNTLFDELERILD